MIEGKGMFSIRLARRADARAIAIMSRDLIETGLGWSWTPPRVLRNIRDRNTNVIVAVAGGRIVGFAVMSYLEQEAHLLLFAVSPQRRRSGVGTALVEWLEKTALVAGIETIHLEVRARNNGARRFYRRLGYEEGDTLRGYYRGVEAAVRIRRRLWPALNTNAS
ncbi:MAG: ribosomal protein S18-alanine N-acetyltransferase [Gammaproteobacteria bacterium]|nr:ribosomal protein S18-alanine N-acetyltransferase [Gammaproteobacteria bacterium]